MGENAKKGNGSPAQISVGLSQGSASSMKKSRLFLAKEYPLLFNDYSARCRGSLSPTESSTFLPLNRRDISCF